VQENLANTVHTKTYRECKATRARICLRKLGKLPIESAAIEKMIKKAVKDKSNDYKEGLSLQDVIDAFLCGDEVTYFLASKSCWTLTFPEH
jgi:hypothetical protein